MVCFATIYLFLTRKISTASNNLLFLLGNLKKKKYVKCIFLTVYCSYYAKGFVLKYEVLVSVYVQLFSDNFILIRMY